MSSFVVLGSGASSAVPFLGCLLEDPDSDIPRCCAVCMDAHTRVGSRNKRGNVSSALRFQRPDGQGVFNVVVDCGKTFRDTVQRVWPSLSPPLARMHALLLSHPHADAFMGLDDLREVSPSFPIHVYCHAPTYERLCGAFPYLTGTSPPRVCCSGGEGEPGVGSDSSPPPPGAPADATAAAATAAADAAATSAAAAAAGGAASTPTMKPLKTFVADLVFHIITPWVPFVLEGSGGLVVTPFPCEHSGPLGTPDYPEENSCLGFEFGGYLASPREGGGPTSNSPTPLPPPTILGPPDARGLPTLPPWNGDRILWVSDVRALSASLRAFLAARPITLLFMDALGHRVYPTHFSLPQAIACAVDLAGPGSATSSAHRQSSIGNGAAAAKGSCRVHLVGMNHDIEHHCESQRMGVFCREARVGRPKGGNLPLVWGEEGGGGKGEETEPLGLTMDFSYDGLATPVSITHPIASLAALRAEVDAVRAAALDLCTGVDQEDYLVAAVALSEELADYSSRKKKAEEKGGVKEGGSTLAEGGREEDATPRIPLRRREDYKGCLPPHYASYDISPSKVFRGDWQWGRKSTQGVAPQ